MKQKPSDTQIEDFVKRVEAQGPLRPEDATIVRYLFVTITAQADMLAKLSFKLDILNAFISLAGDTIASSGITSLQESLGNAKVNDFSLQEARTQVDNVLREIEQQTQLIQVLGSIAKFAVRFAPLVLA